MMHKMMHERLTNAWNGKRVLVTGGHGFLGSHLLPRLRALGAEVIAPTHSELELKDRSATLAYFAEQRPQIVIHMAAVQGGVGFINDKPAEVYLSNLLINTHTLEATGACGAERILCLGSSCAYPDDPAHDLTEDDIWSGPMHPSVAHYGITKKVELLHLDALRRQTGLLGTVLIPSSMLGERDDFSPERSHVAGALIRKFVAAQAEGIEQVELWGDGSPVREFMYVGDCVEALLRVATLARPPVLLNIGSGEGTSIRTLADTIKELTDFRGTLFWDTTRPNGSPRKVISSAKAKQILEWQPAVSLKEALARTLEWYRSAQTQLQVSGSHELSQQAGENV